MLDVGIIGFGKMGRLRADCLERTGRARVTVVFDPSHGDTRGIPTVASEEEVIRARVDAIFICTPNYLNKPLTIAGLLAQKHVFCEKPPGFTAADVEEIAKVEGASGRKLMYGFNHRHHGSIKAMHQSVASGQYGRLLWMRGRYGKSVDHNYFNTWRAKKELAGGGILLDQGIHMLDLFLLLAGEFDEVQAMVSNLYWKLEGIEDNVFLNLRNRKTGVVASLHSTMTQWRHLFSLEVFLERGYMVLNGLKTQSGSYGDEILTIAKNRTTAPAATWEDEERTIYHADTSWDDETAEFLDAVIGDRPVRHGSSADALRVMRLIDGIYSSERHRNDSLHERLYPRH